MQNFLNIAKIIKASYVYKYFNLNKVLNLPPSYKWFTKALD